SEAAEAWPPASNTWGWRMAESGWLRWVRPSTVTATTTVSSRARKTPVTHAFSSMDRIAMTAVMTMIAAPTRLGLAPGQMTPMYWPAPSAMELGMMMAVTRTPVKTTQPTGRRSTRATTAAEPP